MAGSSVLERSEGKGFESPRARHFGTELGTPKGAVFALEAATSVRSSSLFDPMMRTSFASTSTRCASSKAVARKWTSRQVAELSAFFSHPTGPHLAAFILPIARSAVCASPVPHNSSLSCDLTRTRRSAQAAVSVQTHCSRYVDSLAGRTCVMFAKWTEARTQELHRLCPLFADRTQEDGKQTGRGQAHIPASHALTGQLLRLQWLMARPQPP
jgi:hypothetical protein